MDVIFNLIGAFLFLGLIILFLLPLAQTVIVLINLSMNMYTTKKEVVLYLIPYFGVIYYFYGKIKELDE